MKQEVLDIWPEINWIENKDLREKTLTCWCYALDHSALTADDLKTMPFSLLVKDCTISFMTHKRTTVKLAVEMAKIMQENFVSHLKINMDILISGAILVDIGKLLEYDKENGKLVTSKAGKLIRHPFSGLAIADRFDIPPEVQHIIATHSVEGDHGKRTIESIIVHHADFVSFEPFKA